MSTMMRDIISFHEKFELEYRGDPRKLEESMAQFRIRFMEEELKEYIAAHQTGDLHGQFDALIDLVYVTLGTAYLQGFNFPAGWNRVQHANMQKVRALRTSDSKRGSIYDVVKPEGWTAPDLSDLIKGK